MKTAEERSKYKEHFFKLGQGRIIPLNDTEYWKFFWKIPESANDIYELLTADDIKTIRDKNRANFVSLVRIISLKIVEFSRNDSFPSSRNNIRYLLSCVRLLTKLIPFLYELNDYSDIEEHIFWSKNYNPLYFVKSEKLDKSDNTEDGVLGANLSKSLIDLAFLKQFTIDSQIISKNNKALSVWESGIGTTAKSRPPNPIIDSNRVEILKLLITLSSNAFYQTSSQMVSTGSRFLSVLVTCTPKVELLTLVCSLINLVCGSGRSSSEDGSIYNDMRILEMRHLCITYAIQLLAIMVVYPLPSQENLQFLSDLNLLPVARPYNMVRAYVGKLHKNVELHFLSSYLINTLKAPMELDSQKFNIYKTNGQPSLWATETVILLWELVQCNKNFRSLLEEHYMDELFIIITFYIITFNDVKTYKNMVRICCYFMLYLSSGPVSLDRLFDPIDSKIYDFLSLSFNVSPMPINVRDFVVTMISNLLIKLADIPSDNQNGVSDLLFTTLVEILYNLIPALSTNEIEATNNTSKKLANFNFRGGLSYVSCSSITQLVSKFSTKTFLLQKSFHSDLLALLIRAVCSAIIKYPKSSRMLLYTILKNEKIYDKTWNTIYSFNSDYLNSSSKLESIDDRDENEEDVKSLDSNQLSKVESFASDQISFNSNYIPDDEVSTSLFIQSLAQNSVNISEQGPKFSPHLTMEEVGFLKENDAINAALRPELPTGMTKKAKEKLPRDAPLRRTWGGNDSLRIILTIVIPFLKLLLEDSSTSRDITNIEAFEIIKKIELADFDKMIKKNQTQINHDFLPGSELQPLKFTWSQLSLGWYVSLLYGNIYNSISNVKNYAGIGSKLMKNLSNSIASISKMTSAWVSFTNPTNDTNTEAEEWILNSSTSINHWAHTSIKLFKIESPQNDGFFGSISKLGNQAVPGTPGGVNDMTNTLVRRFSDFRMNSSNGSRTSISSNNVPIEEEHPKYFRNSITSLHSLNTLNRTRSNTPRNSISM